MWRDRLFRIKGSFQEHREYYIHKYEKSFVNMMAIAVIITHLNVELMSLSLVKKIRKLCRFGLSSFILFILIFFIFLPYFPDRLLISSFCLSLSVFIPFLH
jgi:hypothetical protein